MHTRQKRSLPFPVFRLLLILSLFSGCAPAIAPLPLSDSLPAPARARVFAGTGEAFRSEDGQWVRMPSYDYEFIVLHRRYADGWESIKEVHRRHPEYDGRGGERDQTLYFRVRHPAPDSDGVPLSVESTLGSGQGSADRQFGEMTIEFKPDISRFAPFNTYRITQHIGEHRVSEVIELLKVKDGGEIPFMKMVEEGIIYEPAGTENR